MPATGRMHSSRVFIFSLGLSVLLHAMVSIPAGVAMLLDRYPALARLLLGEETGKNEPADAPVLDPASNPAPTPVPPEERVKEVRLGIDESDSDSVVWMGFADSTPHAAPKSQVDQSAMTTTQAGVPMPSGAEPSERVLAEPESMDQPSNLSAPTPPAPLPEPPSSLSAPIDADPATPEPIEPERIDADAEPKPPPMPIGTPEGVDTQSPVKAKPIARLPERAVDSKAERDPKSDTPGDAPIPDYIPADQVTPQEPDAARPPALETAPVSADPSPTSAPVTEPKGEAESKPMIDPEAVTGAIIDSVMAVARSMSEVAREVNKQLDAAAERLETETPPVAQVPSLPAPPVTPPSQPVPAQPAPVMPQVARPAVPGGAPVSPGDPGIQSDKESDASATTIVAEYRNGKVKAGAGLDIKTVRPTFSKYTKVTAVPTNPIVEIWFDRSGSVRNVEMKRSSGYRDVDEPVKNAVWAWTARGKVLEELATSKPDGVVKIEITLLLRG